ncbi:MAG: phosphatase PAP2 family protein [Syntrophothermus sp.]
MLRPAKHAALASASCLALLSLLATLVVLSDPLEHADASALGWFAQYEASALGSLATTITFFAEPIPLLIALTAICAYGLRRERRLEAAAAVLVVVGANITTQVLKYALSHPRLQAVLPHEPDLTTFPSGHVTAAASIVIALAWVVPARRRRLALTWGSAFVVAVGLSVLVLEWHFPTDVAGAILVALAWGFGVLALYLVLRDGPPGLLLPGRRGRAPSRRGSETGAPAS